MFDLLSVTTLKATFNKVSIQPGISKPIFEACKKQVARMKNKNHALCNPLFDQISIQPHLDYLLHEYKVMDFDVEDTVFSQINDVSQQAHMKITIL